MTDVFVQLALLVAFFLQAAAGFGSALFAMPILISLIGVQTASPLFILTMQASGLGLMWHYRNSFSFPHVWRLLLAAVVTIPIGAVLASIADQRTVLLVLGFILVAYSIYGLIGAKVPRLEHTGWGYVAGILTGLLHGAYNTGGPPMVMYGNAQAWHPFEFKSNLRFLFFIMNWVVIFSHVAQGNYTGYVLSMFLISIPVSFIGLWLGFSLDRYLQPDVFRRVIQVILLVLGLSMIF